MSLALAALQTDLSVISTHTTVVYNLLLLHHLMMNVIYIVQKLQMSSNAVYNMYTDIVGWGNINILQWRNQGLT